MTERETEPHDWFPSVDLRRDDVVFLPCGSPPISRPFVVLDLFAPPSSVTAPPKGPGIVLDCSGIIDTRMVIPASGGTTERQWVKESSNGATVGVPMWIRTRQDALETVCIPAKVLIGPDGRRHVIGQAVVLPKPFVVRRSNVLLLGVIR